MAIKGVKTMVDEAMAEIKTISVDEAIPLMDDDNHVIVDIRDVRELDHDGMVPGAFHAPRGMLEFWVDPQSPYHKDIFASGKTFVFYCRSGWRSALATKAVQDMGLAPVCHIEGGFGAWMEADAPIGERPKKKK
ncbi:MAG: rhodanese-like domain-containing protein [Proteobacteria bacterium]|nr:rhodanese-like domain-containing protein [Pseudomonadota bacterium]MDA1022193.1 rhodanese-like domain-containing protein [Pseudomonadota bacterium]